MYPEWVLEHKIKGTNISCINGRYYLYEVGSVWNKEKKRAQKITKKYLGRITKNGLIPPKTKIEKEKTPISVKESGASSIICDIGRDILEKLKETFPQQALMLFALAAIRTIEHCPFKRVEQVYNHSFLSEIFSGLKLSGKDISLFLKEFGCNREKIVTFMRSFIGSGEHIIFDGTSIISKSEKMNINRLGYNAHKQYDPQINLLYAFACQNKVPIYYRIIAGSVRDVSAFKLSIEESKLKIVFLDNELKNQEEKDYINRIENKIDGYSKAGFIDRQFKFGTIVIKSNSNKTPEEIYALFKQRQEIEQSFDSLKNLLEQDKSYMQNEKSLESWAFINHISLILHYKIYNLLREKNLLSKYSVADFLYHLKYIFKVKTNNLWLTSEISSKTHKLLAALNLHIT